MPPATTTFAQLVEDIGDAGAQLTDLGACEGAAGNISVFTPSLSCPLDAREEVELPVPAPSLAGGWVVITAAGQRLRDVRRRPQTTVVALEIHDGGTTATLHAAVGARPSSEWNSHLAVHDDHRARRGVARHVVAHAQPRRLVFLSHLPGVTTTDRLEERLMRWAPETAVVVPGGIALTPFEVPGSAGQVEPTVRALAVRPAVLWAKHGVVTRSDASATRAADLVEYLETAAAYELMNLALGAPATGLSAEERGAVARAAGLDA